MILLCLTCSICCAVVLLKRGRSRWNNLVEEGEVRKTRRRLLAQIQFSSSKQSRLDRHLPSTSLSPTLFFLFLLYYAELSPEKSLFLPQRLVTVDLSATLCTTIHIMAYVLFISFKGAQQQLTSVYSLNQSPSRHSRRRSFSSCVHLRIRTG